MSADKYNAPTRLERVRLKVVIPAAGLSTRLGRAKQQIAMGNTTLLGHAITTAAHFIEQTAEIPASLPIVVINARDNSAPPQYFTNRIVQLSNPTPELGILSTLRCTQDTTENAEAVLVLLGDQYRVTSDQLQALFYAYLEEPHIPMAAQYQTVADQLNHKLTHLNLTDSAQANAMPRSPGRCGIKDRTHYSGATNIPDMSLDDALLAPPMIWPQHYWQKLLSAQHPRAGQTLLHTSGARALPMPAAAYDVDTEYDVFLLQQWLERGTASTQ